MASVEAARVMVAGAGSAARIKQGRAERTSGPVPPRYALPRRHFNRLVGRALRTAIFAAIAVALSFTPAAAAPAKLLVLGDSLTAGYGLPPEQAFPARLEAALKTRGLDVQVIGAGVSGDTTAGGRARLEWALAGDPDAAIVQLGANDALRGIDPAVTRDNLDAILKRLKEKGVRVLLAGMYAPPNWGRDYEQAFKAIYPALAKKHDVALYPFFLDGVATDPALNQGDGIHPNAKGVAEIVDRIAPSVVRLLKQGD